LVVALVLWTGCGPTVPSATPIPSAAAPSPSPLFVFLAVHPNEATPLARLDGTLEEEDGCLFIQSKGGRVDIAWPPGTRWDGVRHVLVVKGVEAPLGEHVTLAGGLYDVGVDDLAQTEWIRPPVYQCVGDLFWFVGSLSVDVAQ
jgi:hypothetical protein